MVGLDMPFFLPSAELPHCSPLEGLRPGIGTSIRMGQCSTQLLPLLKTGLIFAIAIHSSGCFILMVKEVILRLVGPDITMV